MRVTSRLFEHQYLVHVTTPLQSVATLVTQTLNTLVAGHTR
jgi:hypothetical protein